MNELIRLLAEPIVAKVDPVHPDKIDGGARHPRPSRAQIVRTGSALFIV